MIGIEKIGVYAGHLALPISALLQARGLDPERYLTQYLLQERSVFAAFEDPVTMAANAAEKVLTAESRASVVLVLVATESGIDFGKPISGWVQRLCGLPREIRNLEIKHACYGLTGAVRLAQTFLEGHPNAEARALVIGVDASRQHLGDPAEPICGGAATALLLSRSGKVIALPPVHEAGVWCQEVADTFRPTSTMECGNNDLSLFSYLDALDGSLNGFLAQRPDFQLERDAAFHVYHAPFPAMCFQAHRQISKRFGAAGAKQIRVSFEERVLPGLGFSRRIGTSYGSSVWLALTALAGRVSEPTPVSVFSYGSGCQSEFFLPHVGAEGSAAQRLEGELAARRFLTVAEYEEIEQERLEQCDRDAFTIGDSPRSRALLEAHFAGSAAGEWMLASVQDYVREYRRIGEAAS